MACERKKTSWSKFEYVFRSVVPQERKGNVVLCYYAHRLVTFEVTRKTRDECSHLISIPLSVWEVQKSFSAQTLRLLPRMSSLQVPSCDRKGNAEVLCFRGPPGRIRRKAGTPSKGDGDTWVSTGLCCQCPWPLSKPSFAAVASCQIWNHYASELTISQPLWAELLFSSLKG